MKRTILAAVLMLMVAGLATTRAMAAGAEDLYKSKCAMCHGPDGSGDTTMGKKYNIRDLRSADVQKESDAQLEEIITKGKNKMPSYDGKLTKDQIKDLVAYIRTLKK